MGATVSVQKKVAAFKTPEGRTAYLLFEQTYDKRTYPHRPRWGCCAIGYLEDVIKFIFWAASSAEGGMVQTPDGYTTPEAYATAWLKAMSAPVSLDDRKVELEFGPYKILGSDDGIRARILETLRADGFPVVATTLDAGPMEVSLHADFPVLHSIFTKNRIYVGPWMLFTDLDDYHWGEVDMRLAYEPEPAKLSYTPPEMYRIERDSLLVRQEDGTFRAEGYSVVSSYVASYGDKQLAHPGSFRANFKALRAATKVAMPVDSEAIVDFSSYKEAEGDVYRTRNLLEVASKLGKTNLNFSVRFGEVAAAAKALNEPYLVHSLLSGADIVWTLPQGTPQPTAQEELFA